MTEETSDQASTETEASTPAAVEPKPVRTLQSLEQDLDFASQEWVTAPSLQRKQLVKTLLESAADADSVGTVEGDKMAARLRKKAKTIGANATG